MAAPRTLPQYDYMRQQAEQQNTAQSQQEEEALKRRLATAGALNTGAGIKQQNLQGESAIQRKEQTMQGIGFQEAAAQQALDEAQKVREFQTSERLGGQQFAGEQAGIGRQFATSERLGGQQFAGDQAGLGRTFQTSERLGAQSFTAGQQTAAQSFTAGESALERKAKLDAETAAATQQADQFKITSDLAKQAQAAKERIDNATMALANDQADIDMITQAQNAGVAALGEDATPQGIAQYAQSFEALVAQMKQKRLRLSGGAMSTATDINGNSQQPGQVYNIGSGTYQDTK